MVDTVKRGGKLSSANSQGNSLSFLAEQSIYRNINTAEIVSIELADAQGPDSTGGYATATPLVSQTDNYDQAIAPAPLARLPFWRPQAGKAAILMQPQPQDKALAVFTKRDSSAIRPGTTEPVPPASFRTFDLADGFLLNGFLGDAPDTWLLLDPASGEIELSAKSAPISISCRESGDIAIQTASGEINIESSGQLTVKSGTQVKVECPNIILQGNVTITGGLTLLGGAVGAGNGPARFLRGIEVEQGGIKNTGANVISNNITLETHTHSGIERGNSSTNSPN